MKCNNFPYRLNVHWIKLSMVSACGHRSVVLKKVVSRFLFYQVPNTYFHNVDAGHHGWPVEEEAATHHRDVADYSLEQQQAFGCNCNHFDKLEGGGK